jgi:hypothetical protein
MIITNSLAFVSLPIGSFVLFPSEHFFGLVHFHLVVPGPWLSISDSHFLSLDPFMRLA